MKKFISGAVLGVIISVGIQVYAFDSTSYIPGALKQIGEILEKTYSKQKSIDERLQQIQNDVEKIKGGCN